MSATDQPSEDELRAAYEAEIKKIRVEQIVLEQVVSLINLGMRRTGLAPGTEDERDVGQVRTAIEAVRALLPLIEQSMPAQGGQIRDALSQLQLAFVRLGGAPEEAPAGTGPASGPAAPPSGTSGTPAGDPAGAPGPQPGPDAPVDPAAPAEPTGEPSTSGEPGPAQRSGRLWVPGQ